MSQVQGCHSICNCGFRLLRSSDVVPSCRLQGPAAQSAAWLGGLAANPVTLQTAGALQISGLLGARVGHGQAEKKSCCMMTWDDTWFQFGQKVIQRFDEVRVPGVANLALLEIPCQALEGSSYFGGLWLAPRSDKLPIFVPGFS